ncbi:hypothetical protein [Desulfolutivibrio sulfoxidireducens]|uniref:hypothetical protein n=1 Tax=Desulfolutivibrio sulfoxidireducens TaxID=2773299 RepID=UPI00159D03B1|nr:hypothetical protein [Desulfolutivibrio sulfoxidireducens]QLA19654.1 hypothetical protein GD604_07850 [Desulfolutivibrio sulfoxidireducens]
MKHLLVAVLALAAMFVSAMPATPPALAAASPASTGADPAPVSLKGRGLVVGGPCSYADHPGTATILAVTPAPQDDSASAPPYQAFQVTYVFTADQPLPALGAPEEGRTQRLTLTNGWDPGRRFLEKYDIRPGRRIPCVLRIIQSGTCTPLILEFPGIDRSDYFEAGK